MGGDDINHYYWGGGHNQRGYCRCGVHQTCRNNKKYCNCDDLDAFDMVHDEGNFTIKEHLPVRKVKLIHNSIFHLSLELLTKFWKMRLKVA